jgi:hypothetical protein
MKNKKIGQGLGTQIDERSGNARALAMSQQLQQMGNLSGQTQLDVLYQKRMAEYEKQKMEYENQKRQHEMVKEEALSRLDEVLENSGIPLKGSDYFNIYTDIFTEVDAIRCFGKNYNPKEVFNEVFTKYMNNNYDEITDTRLARKMYPDARPNKDGKLYVKKEK